MAFSARSVIDAARLRHVLFDDKATPAPVALALLNGVAHRLRAEVLARYPHALATQTTIELPLTDFELGAELPPYHTVLDITAFLSVNGADLGEQVVLIPFEQRYDAGVWPAAYLVRDGLYLKGDPGAWQGYSSLVVTYVAADAPLGGLDELVDLPNAFATACTELLAAMMGTRLSDRLTPQVLDALYGASQQSQELALRNLTSQRRTERWSVREY